MADPPEGASEHDDPGERRHAFHALDDAALADFLRPVLGSRRILSARPLRDGYVNTNYHVRAERLGAPVVLRLWARGAVVAATEIALLRRVRERVPVPDVLHADTKGTERGCPYAVLRFVPGILLRDLLSQNNDEATAQAARSVGETLAAIGSFSFPAAGFLDAVNVAQPFVRGATAAYREHTLDCLRQPIVQRRLGPALAARVEQLVVATAAELDAAAGDARALVHSDYKAINLLVHPNANGIWRVSAVLDWEFAHAGTPLLDWAILLRERATLPPAFGDNVARGYTDAGGAPLPPNWRRVTRLIDLVNLCEFLTNTSERGAMIAPAQALIRATVEEFAPSGAETTADDGRGVPVPLPTSAWRGVEDVPAKDSPSPVSGGGAGGGGGDNQERNEPAGSRRRAGIRPHIRRNNRR